MNQKGFSHIIVLAIVGTLFVLGFAGWYVWSRNQKDNSQHDQAQTSAPKQDTQKNSSEVKQSDPYEGWLTYTNSTYGISFRYPTDWKVEEASLDNPARSATRQEYAINIKRNENVKYNNTISLEVLDEELERISMWYDSEDGRSSGHTKTAQELKGKSSIQFLSSNQLNSKIYLFGVGNKTYSFLSINEGVNMETDPTYWTKFTKVFDSFQITK